MNAASARNLVTDGFYPFLLSNVLSAAPDLPLDPVVFRSLLLSILAPGDKNLILRSSDENVALVQNITALVSPLSLSLSIVCERHASTQRADLAPIPCHLLIIIT